MSSHWLFAQKDSTRTWGTLSGSVQVDAQRYENDKTQAFANFDNRFGLNTYLQLAYQYKNWQASVRGEGYTPALIGYPSVLSGIGLASRFVRFQKTNWNVTLGNFYEQFGNGLIFRATEQRSLGMDTSLDGFLVRLFLKKYSSKIFYGKQRIGFGKSDGKLIGIDNELKISKLEANHQLLIGLSGIQKFEPYEGILTYMPKQVWAAAGRLNYSFKTFSLQAEYAHKSPDPADFNRFSSQIGRAFYLTSALLLEKATFSLDLKRTENMDFRSQRGESLNNGLINFIPIGTRLHSYRLLTLYPYTAQLKGEMGGQLESIITLNEASLLTFNLSAMNNLKRYATTDTRQFYTKFFELGETILYRNAHVNFEKNWENIQTNWVTDYTVFNYGEILGGKPETVHAFTAIADATFRLTSKNALHTELQHLATHQHKGNWLMLFAEWSHAAPSVSFFLSDEINYGSFGKKNAIHYYNAGAAYALKSNRISISYGRVREGLLCVGGVCRLVPAYKGLSLNLLSSF